MTGLGGLNKSAHGVVVGLVQLQLPVVDTPAQASLSRAERSANVRGAFVCDLPLEGKVVVVIDDVMTTGASLDALARSLKACGARRVENRVVARTLTSD